MKNTKTRIRRQIIRLEGLKRPPLIIVGCHRSGTSMLVTLLRENRVFFGDDLMSHEESKFFLTCNEYLLKQAHASWDRPHPYLDRGPNGIDPADLLVHARIDHEVTPYQFMRLPSLTKMRLGLYRTWGWKDPRTSVTLPFWLQVFPEARVLHICRHGLDVALSLNKREKGRDAGDHHSAPELIDLRNCFGLWKVYEQAVLSAVADLPPERYVRVRYEDVLANDQSTFDRLKALLGSPLQVKPSALKKENAGRFWAELGNSARDYMEDPLLRQLGYV